MKHQGVRDTLIRRAIAVIASEGLDKTTTKAIVKDTGINEAYIYRYFEDKEDLLAKAFAELDNEMVSRCMQHVSVMQMKELVFEQRCRLFFAAIWRFLLGNSEKCLSFIRYYYSPYFMRNSVEEHTARYQPFLEKIYPAFKEEANVWMLLNHILNVMLDFTIKVLEGAVPDNDDTAEHVFRLVYNSVSPYFKEREE